MTKQIIITYTTEGTTDRDFFESIIQRTFERIAIQCSDDIEIFKPHYFAKPKGKIEEKALIYVNQIRECGAMVFCLHIDADDKTDQQAFHNQIVPAFDIIKSQYQALSNCLIGIVPIQMTEAWMLADTELLKSELGTNDTDENLGINKHPEVFADPKQIIENAIRISRQKFTKRRRSQLKIDDLYKPLGQKIKLENLEKLPSYRKFKNSVINVFQYLQYLK